MALRLGGGETMYAKFLQVGPGAVARCHYGAAQLLCRTLPCVGLGRFQYPGLWLLGHLFGPAGWLIADLRDGIRIQVALADPYWMYALLNHHFEPELESFFGGLSPARTLFIDCGANIGWWTLIARNRFHWDSIAVEPGAHLVRSMERNRELSNTTFEIVRKAVWHTAGERLRFQSDRAHHAAGHLADVPGHIPIRRLPLAATVETTTVDALVYDWKLSHSTPDRIIIKVDVEGAEPQVIDGAAATLAEGAILIFEDHGSDRECQATKSAWAQGLKVFAPRQGGLIPIRTLGDVKKLKVSAGLGYNFVAVRDEATLVGWDQSGVSEYTLHCTDTNATR